MDGEQLYVGKVKDREPETFVIVGITHGLLTNHSFGLKEADLWAKLHKMGVDDQEIKRLIENARKNPTP